MEQTAPFVVSCCFIALLVWYGRYDVMYRRGRTIKKQHLRQSELTTKERGWMILSYEVCILRGRYDRCPSLDYFAIFEPSDFFVVAIPPTYSYVLLHVKNEERAE